MAYDTFLSYSHADYDRAKKVRDRLAEDGLQVWMDREHIGLGAYFRRSINSALQESRTITPILTSSALQSDEVFTEVKFGIDRGLKIIPVVLSPRQLREFKRWRELLDGIDWGRVDFNINSRNLTDEVLQDIALAICRPDDRRCPILCVYHFKGGVGKTTIAAHLAAQMYYAAIPPISVLMIDCDAQSNLSSLFLTREMLALTASSSRNLVGMLEPKRLISAPDWYTPYQVAPGRIDDHTLHQVQTTIDLNEAANKRLALVPNAITSSKYSAVGHDELARLFANFQNAIQKLSLSYDMIILDCNPSTTLLSHCALNAATDIIIPLRADKYTADGLGNIDELLKNFVKIEFVHGEGRERKQLWTVVNFAAQPHIEELNLDRSKGSGAEADLLRDILDPLKSGLAIGQFKASLLDTRIPELNYLRSRPVDTERLDPSNPPSRKLLKFFDHIRAKPTAKAFTRLAEEIRSRTRGVSAVETV